MAYRVVFKPTVDKSLDRLPRHVQSRVIEKANALSSNPRPPGSVKLAGPQHLHRIRVGDWRVLYHIDDAQQKVTITLVAHRRESYRGL